ncbi:hypothetical protein DL771_008977 [Monosporascus sp. 5C6A]|nr:hypothetical protein DL771_008977 [Monosporascus sp. 5C6A]
MTEEEFIYLQKILVDASNVLWVSCGALLGGSASPEYAMTCGLLRSLRSEQASLKATLLDFTPENVSTDESISQIASLAMAQYKNDQSLESEYYVQDGQVFISRFTPAGCINQTYSQTDVETHPQPFNPDANLVGKIKSGRIVFENVFPGEASLQPGEVEFRPLTTGLNSEDVAVISGASFETDFSHETAGIVTRVGSGVTVVSPCDRIVAFSSDKFSNFQRVTQSLVQKLNPNELCTTIASLPMQYAAALYSLENLAKLQSNESVLVLPGVGLVGAAAIRVTQALGGLPLVEPSVAREAWRYLPAFSRFVSSGTPSSSVIDSVPASRGASYFSFNIVDLLKKPRVSGSLLERTLFLFRQGAIPAPPLASRNIAELNESVASFSDTLFSTKTVISHETGNDTLEVIPSRPHMQLRPDATYLLVGCLGGLGRSLTSWMMKRGARNFTFLSRSGAVSTQASILVKNLEAEGAKVDVFRGDAATREDVQKAVSSIPADRPFGGVVNAAMVLRDCMFHNMLYENWPTSVRPKTLGSKHLHEATQDLPLDFFLMTSSVSGVLGTPGQTNYAAGNTYMDALARHRRSQAKPACAVILPMVLGVGVVAENSELEASLKRSGMYGIDEEALLRTFEVAILEEQQQQLLGPSLTISKFAELSIYLYVF